MGSMAPANASRSTRNENIKTMVISAQITAATSMLEIIGNLVISVTHTFIAKFLGHGTLIQSIILYFVFLPYVFFMNTDKNKKMVLQDGWINLFRHVIRNTAWKMPVPVRKNRVTHSSKENPNIVSGQENKTNIFIVSDNKIKDLIPMREALYTPTMNIDMYMAEPSSSIGKIGAKSEDTIHDSSRKWNNVRKDILYDLLKYLKDEESYIENFKEFVTFEDSMKQGEDCTQQFIEEREERNREACSSRKNYDFKVEQLKQSITLQLECHEDEEVARHDRKACSIFSGDIIDRIRLRKEAITRLLKHSTDDDEELYKECFEIFIDMEENFII